MLEGGDNVVLGVKIKLGQKGLWRTTRLAHDSDALALQTKVTQLELEAQLRLQSAEFTRAPDPESSLLTPAIQRTLWSS